MDDDGAAHESPALEVHGLRKEFPGTLALADVDVQIGRGEVHALVGQNGSGKSTFIKILAGFHTPDSGTVSVLGRALDLEDPTSGHRAGLRFVHQDLGLVSSLSTVDNLALGFGYRRGRFGNIKGAAEGTAARHAVNRLGHDFDVEVPVERLSAVERTTIAIARAMQGWDEAGAVLVLDEPTATMSAAEVEKVLDLVRSVCRQGASVLYVSHHLDEILQVADGATILRDGHKIATLDRSALNHQHIVDLMTGARRDDQPARREPPGDAPVALELSGLSGSVLRDVELSVRAGEIVGIAGLDGSGREELNGLVFGAKRRTAGSVRLAGAALRSGDPASSVASGVGFVPADRRGLGLLMDLDLSENMVLTDVGAYWRRFALNAAAERSDVERWMQRLSVVARDPRSSIDSLSGGNQQKVVLGKWLRLSPRVLLLDEPTQGVDIGAKADIHAVIDQTADAGTAVLVSSSDEDELVRLCSKVFVFRRGVIARELTGTGITVATIAAETLLAATDRELEMATDG